MSFSDSWGAAGGWAGAIEGQNFTKWEKALIKKNIDQQYNDAQGIKVDGLDKTAFDGISTDPRTRQAQMQALSQLQGLASSHGNDAQSQAMMAQANTEAAGYEQAQRAAIQQNAAARGMGGSGTELAGLLSAQQGGANRSQAAATQAAADSEKRAVDATENSAKLGSAIRGEDYSEAASKAAAEDQAKRTGFGARMTKYGAVKDARAGQTNYYGADRAETIGNLQAGGQAAGSIYGSGADVGASYITGGMSGGGGGGGGGGMGGMMKGGGGQDNPGGRDAGSNSSKNPYAAWGSW